MPNINQQNYVGPQRAKQMFLSWLRRNEPFIFRVAQRMAEIEQRRATPQLSGFWSGVGDVFKNAAGAITNLAPDIMAYRQQKEIMDMQMKRAEQGLPPANIEDYSPAIKISPEITPETEQAIDRVAQKSVAQGIGQLKTPLIIGAGLIAAVLFLKN